VLKGIISNKISKFEKTLPSIIEKLPKTVGNIKVSGDE
jgi:hypothetical protein